MPTRAELISMAKDKDATIINGGPCPVSLHSELTHLEKLAIMRHLKLELRHQSTWPGDLEEAMRREAERMSRSAALEKG